MKHLRFFVTAFLVMALLAFTARSTATRLAHDDEEVTPITTASLVREMTDLDRLTRTPDPGYRTIQFSSYDRRSCLPGGPGWFSNADGFGKEPIPNFESVLKAPDENGIGEYLICDVQSPGAIVRTWTAAINGSIRMYLDGSDVPVFDGSADDFLRRPYDVFAREVGLDPDLFDGSFNQQNASYCPIPFASRCRIVWIGNLQQVHFYEVQVRVYEADAEVRTFEPNDLKTHESSIEQTATALRDSSKLDRKSARGAATTPISARIEPGETQDVLLAHDGSRLITELRMRLRTDSMESRPSTGLSWSHVHDFERVLRQTVLQVWFDDHASPQIEAPLGDFFGAAPGVNPFDATPFTVSEDDLFTSRWFMPYANSVRMAVKNMSDTAVHIEGGADHEPCEWEDQRSMHLYALWRVDHDLIADPEHPQDIPFIIAHGQGRYVGTASIMLNPTDVPTPAGGWWGEGDEKIFVDDDVQPSTYGTGSEDYYNYAWSIPDIFGFAYCGQPRNDGPGNRGFVTNHRWHILDDLPFGSRLAFFMELWPHDRRPGYSYARLSYFYARPGVVTDHLPITPDDVRPLELAPAWQPRAYWGAQNSTFLEPETALDPTTFATRTHQIEDNLFSDGRCFVWLPDAASDTLNFTFAVDEDARYAVDLCAFMTDRSGQIRMWVDGKDRQLTEFDLSSAGHRILRRVRTQPLELAAGEHTLHVQSIDPEHQSVGIDFLWIQKR